MKRLSYVLLLLCLVACKKTEVNDRVKFAKIAFQGKMDYPIEVKHEGVIEDFTLLGVPLGERQFEIYNQATQEKLMDTVMNITGPATYYVIQPNSKAAPIVIKALDVSAEQAAPAGAMKLNMSNLAQAILPGPKMDVVILSTLKTAVYEPADTVHEVTTGYMNSFFPFVRPVRMIGSTRLVQTRFKYNFINSSTGEAVKNHGGSNYTTAELNLPNSLPNIFTILFTYSENLDPTLNENCIEKGGKYYVITPIFL